MDTPIPNVSEQTRHGRHLGRNAHPRESDLRAARDRLRLLRWQGLTRQIEATLSNHLSEMFDVTDATEEIHFFASQIATHIMRQEEVLLG